MESKIFTKVSLTETIKLHPKYIGPKAHEIVLEKLCEKLEGKCTSHGYIKQGSISILKVQPGIVELIGLNGFITYTVSFSAEVCNPLLKSVIKCKVVNTNKFGILAEAGFYRNTDYINVLEIIIAKNSVNITSDIDLEKIRIGDEITIEVVGKKYNLNDTKVSIVGRVIIADGKRRATQPETNAPTTFFDDNEQEPEEPENEPIEEIEPDEEVAAENAATEADEEEENVEEEVEEEEDEDKSVKGGAFFSDVESFADEFNMYESGSEHSAGGSDVDD